VPRQLDRTAADAGDRRFRPMWTAGRRHLRSAIDLDADPGHVWQILTDVRSYPSWNPFIRYADGPLVAGGRLRIKLLLGGRLVTLRPRVTTVDEPRELRWLARQVVPGLFDVDRRFLLRPTGASGCRFVQSETATGILAPLVMRFLRRHILYGYRALEKALAERAEQAGHAGTRQGDPT
jgi:hypothetical protein